MKALLCIPHPFFFYFHLFLFATCSVYRETQELSIALNFCYLPIKPNLEKGVVIFLSRLEFSSDVSELKVFSCRLHFIRDWEQTRGLFI